MDVGTLDDELEGGKSPGATRRDGGDAEEALGADVAVVLFVVDELVEDGEEGRARKNFRLPSKASRT